MFTLLNATRISLILIGVYVASLAAGYGRDGGWLIESDGNKRTIEFIGVRAAGELVRAGKPAEAYVWDAHRLAHNRVVGRPDNDVYYPWPYPPPYLAVAHLLASMPYVPAALCMIVVTLAGLALAGRAIIGNNAAIAWTIGSPATFINAAVAHTGFLVAGLLGGGLAALRTMPVLAGVLFGLLAIKPQLGLLLPVALVAGRHGRTILAAIGTVAAMVALSVQAYGLDPWLALPAQLDRVADVFRDGRVNFVMLVTPYGVMRWASVPHATAIVVQTAMSAMLALLVWRLWRSETSFELKAAGLIVASLLATPYLFVYDLSLLTVATLFLVRHAGEDGLDQIEVGAIVAGGLLLLVFASVPFPVGLLATIMAGVLIWRRVLPSRVDGAVPA